MNSVANHLNILLLLLALTPQSAAQGWRGLVPLHSTRADVEKVFGAPGEQIGPSSVFYRSSRETVIVQYAQDRPCGIGTNYTQWRVPRNTVLTILVTPTRDLPLASLQIDESKYVKKSGGHRPEDVYYVNEQDGESFVVFQGNVMSITYSPALADYNLRCPGIPIRPGANCKGVTPSAFDRYGEITFNAQKQRLDNFLIALTEEEGGRGYIIAYAGKRTRRGDAKSRAEVAKKYLVTARRFPSSRLYAVDGGYRDRLDIELFVVPKDGCTPVASPTVDPREVKIIRNNSRKPRAPRT